MAIHSPTVRFSIPIVVFCVLMNIAAAAEREESALTDLASVRRLVQSHCVECHGGQETFAGVNLATLESQLDVWKNRAVWARAQLMLEGGKMPPEDGPALADKDRQMLARWVQHTLENVDVNRIPRDPGFVPPRRLTGKEYNYTVQDLFGLSDPVYEFPDDLVIGDSFENSADSLSLDALWLEKALDAADATVKAVWSNPTSLDKLLVVRPSPPPIVDEAIFVADRETSDRCDTSGDFSIVAKVVGFPERVFLRAPLGVDQTLGSKVLAFDDDVLIYRISQRRALFGDVRKMEDGKPHWIGLTVRHGRATLYLDGQLLVSRPEFDRPDMTDHLLKIGLMEEEESEEDGEDDDDEQDGPDEDEQNDQEEEEEESFDEEDEELHEEEHHRLKAFLFYADTLPDDAMTTIDQQTSEEELPSPTFRWVEGIETPPDSDFVSVKQATETVTREFLTKAFRREPSRETLDRYIRLFEKGLNAGLTFEIAAQHPIATALTSPEFLFVRDAPMKSEADYPLPATDLSNRLSYFLWSSLPDTRLCGAAEHGRLTDADELIRQVDRMLADERADRFFESFVLQWLKTEGLGDTIRPSADRFPMVTDSLLISMRREGPLYFADAVKHNRPLLNLIDSPYSLVNSELAEHYGLEGVHGKQWQRVNHRDANRGGVLTQAAVLTVSSSPQRTSPVFRGKWVLEVLLGDPPPPPPPNVPSLPTESETASSLRESLALHRRQEACAGCHSRIDPYGLALEQFDAVGALRNKPQDTRTTLHTGEKLHGVSDLKQYLVNEKKDDFLRHLTRKLLAYALGRELQFSDERAVHEIMEHLKTNGLGARTLIHRVVLSEPFRFRRLPKTIDKPN